MERNIGLDLTDAKSFKRHSKTEYKAFTQLKQGLSIQFYVNIDHISLPVGLQHAGETIDCK
jgi:hypothetical protein